jgi:hypothetical protein
MYTVYFTKLSVDFLRLDGARGNATDDIWIRKDFEGSSRGWIVAQYRYLRSKLREPYTNGSQWSADLSNIQTGQLPKPSIDIYHYTRPLDNCIVSHCSPVTFKNSRIKFDDASLLVCYVVSTAKR